MIFFLLVLHSPLLVAGDFLDTLFLPYEHIFIRLVVFLLNQFEFLSESRSLLVVAFPKVWKKESKRKGYGKCNVRRKKSRIRTPFNINNATKNIIAHQSILQQ